MPALLVIGVASAVGFGALWLIRHRAPQTTVDAPPHATSKGTASPGDQRKTGRTTAPAATLTDGVKGSGARSGLTSIPLHTDLTAFSLTPHAGGVEVAAPPAGNGMTTAQAQAIALVKIDPTVAAGYMQYTGLAKIGLLEYGPRAWMADWDPFPGADWTNSGPTTLIGRYMAFRTAVAAMFAKPENGGWDLQTWAGQMSDGDWDDFWLLGVVPAWMTPRFPVPKSIGPWAVGGWNTPYIAKLLQFSKTGDGGMWNAITTTWVNGVVSVVSSAAGGPVGVAIGGGKAVAAGFDGGKGISN